MIRGARMLAVGGSAALHAAAVAAALLFAASIRQPEPLFVDLTTDHPAGDERPAAPATPHKPNAAPSTARAAHARARTAAAPAPDRSAEPAPAPALPASSREMVAPESSASKPSEDRGPSLPAAPPDTSAGTGVASDPTGGTGQASAVGTGVTSDVPSGTGQASAGAGGSRFALAGPGTGRSQVPGEFGPYLAGFRRRIQELVVYPLAARRRGLAGRVEIEVILEPTGRVRDVAVVASSSHSLLDEAAIEAVRLLQPVPLPETLPRRPLRVRLPVVFDLR